MKSYTLLRPDIFTLNFNVTLSGVAEAVLPPGRYDAADVDGEEEGHI
jgi:hypothetical protein